MSLITNNTINNPLYVLHRLRLATLVLPDTDVTLLADNVLRYLLLMTTTAPRTILFPEANEFTQNYILTRTDTRDAFNLVIGNLGTDPITLTVPVGNTTQGDMTVAAGQNKMLSVNMNTITPASYILIDLGSAARTPASPAAALSVVLGIGNTTGGSDIVMSGATDTLNFTRTNTLVVDSLAQTGGTGTAQIPDLASATDQFVLEDVTQTLSNKTFAGLALLETGGGADTITFQAPSLGASYTLTYPIDDGASGQVLSTDGSGVLSWATGTAGSLASTLAVGNTTGGTDIEMTSGDTLNYNVGTGVAVNSATQTTGAGTLTIPDMGGAVDQFVLEDVTQVLTNKTGTDDTNFFRGTELGTTGANVGVVAAAPPSSGQVLTATAATTATWQTPSGGAGTLAATLLLGNTTGGTDISMTSGDTLNYNVGTGVTVNSATQTTGAGTLTIPDMGGAVDQFVLEDVAQTLTNKTGTADTNFFRGTELGTTGANVGVVAAAPPSLGQVLTATAATTATWQTPSSSGNLATVLAAGNATGGTDIDVTAGDVITFLRGTDVNLDVVTQTTGIGTAQIPDLGGGTDQIVLEDVTQVLTNKTGTDDTNFFRGTELGTTGANVDVVAAAPPSSGQVLTATAATTATWQTPSGGAGTLAATLLLGNTTGGTDISMTSGDTLNYNVGTGVTVNSATQTTGAGTLTIPDMGGAIDQFVLEDVAQTLTNKTLTAPTVSGDITFDEATNDLVLAVTDQTVGTSTATVPDLASTTQEFVMEDVVQTLTNKTGTDDTNAFRGTELGTTGANVDVVAAAPPSSGQVLTATAATTATWQTPAGGESLAATLLLGNTTGGTDIEMTSGDTLNYNVGTGVTVNSATQTTGAGTLTIPDMGGAIDQFVLEDVAQVLTNKTGTDDTNAFRGTELGTTGANVDVVAAAPPSSGQVLTATAATTATWQTPAGGAGTLAATLLLGNTTGGTDISMTSGDTLNYNVGTGVTVNSATQTTGAGTLTIPDMGGAIDQFVLEDVAQVLTNKTLTAPTVSGDITFDEATNDLVLAVTDQTVGTSTATVPNLASTTQEFVMEDVVQVLTNKTGTDDTNAFRGTELGTTGANVDVVAAAPPTTGQVLTATAATTATWQTPSGGAGTLAATLLLGNATGGTDISMTSGDTLNYNVGTGVTVNSATQTTGAGTLTIPDMGGAVDQFVLEDVAQTLTNKTGTAGTNAFRGTELGTTGSNVVVTSTAPTAGGGEALVSTNATTATWQQILGLRTIWTPAAAMISSVTSGATSAQVETTTNAVNYKVFLFDATADESTHSDIAFPKSWDLGTVTYQVFWEPTTSEATLNTVQWALQGVFVSDDVTADTAYGTAVTVSDDGATAGDLFVSAVSGAVTIAGTPAEDGVCNFRFFRDVSAPDDYPADARLRGIKLFFTVDAGSDD